MQSGLPIILAILLLPRAGAADEAPASQAIAELSREASAFWRMAPGYVGRETLRQRALTLPKRRLHAGANAVEPPKPEFTHREIVSFYALSSLASSPEALHEFREIVSIDGSKTAGSETARDRLRAEVAGSDDHAKKSLLRGFEKANLEVTATDFGQLLLLFTKGNVSKYAFEPHGSALVGADRAMLFDFRQRAGSEALQISGPGAKTAEPLNGRIWLRESGWWPLRIELNAAHREGSRKIRDEARVDYQSITGGVILPASVVYRRFVNDELLVENIYQYDDWKRVQP